MIYVVYLVIQPGPPPKFIPDVLYGVHVWGHSGPGQDINVVLGQQLGGYPGSMGSGIIMLECYSWSMILNEWQKVVIQNVDVALCIEISLHNHKVSFYVPHDSSPDHNAATTKPVSFADAAFCEPLISPTIDSHSAVCVTHSET